MLWLHKCRPFCFCWYQFSTRPVAKRPLKHNTKYKKHKTHKSQHELPPPYPLAALPSFAMATSAMASNQGTAAYCESVAGTRQRVCACGCLFLCYMRWCIPHWKNRAIGVALALGGRRFIIQHHNQPDSWWSGRGDARVEARGGGSMWRDAITVLGPSNW